jgi:hypothetical protein
MLHARILEPEPFRAALREPTLQPGRLFRAHFDSSLFHTALANTTDAGEVDDVTACALADAVLQAGQDAGPLEVEGDAWVPHFVKIAGAVLGDERLATQLLRGGWLGRVSTGPFAFGSLPLRVIARQATRSAFKAARELVEYGWDSELINLLESAAMRAEREPEHHLLLVGANVPLRDASVTPSRLFDLSRVLREAKDGGFFEVMFQPDRVVVARGPNGTTTLEHETTRNQVEAIAREFGGQGLLVRDVPAFGRLRVASSQAGVVVRFVEAPKEPPSELVEVQALTSGLVVIGGPPASGRSSTLLSLVHAWAGQGRVVATLDEPRVFPVSGFSFDAADEAEFVRAVRLSPAQVVAVDLVDDERAVELALDFAMEGRLAVCVTRGVSLPALVHRVALLDAKTHRRRVAEHLAAVVMLPGPIVLTPSTALRRHLRGNDTPPPPILFERAEA